MTDPTPHIPETVLGLSEAEQRFVLFAGLAAGLVIGLASHWIWALIGDWPIIPFGFLWSSLFESSSLLAIVLRGLAGAMLGLVAGAAINVTNPVVTITDDAVVIRKFTRSQRIDRAEVISLRHAGGKVVILGDGARELYHDTIEGGAEAVAAAFRAHGYPWEAPLTGA